MRNFSQNQAMSLFRRSRIFLPLTQQIRTCYGTSRSIFLSNPEVKPRHLICFKQWTSDMVKETINSAMQLKNLIPNTHGIRMPTFDGAKIMILQEVNQPILHMAVSKAATMLGGHDVSITDNVVWEQDYMGRIFSKMADVIFVSTTTHGCLERFAAQSTVPVLCMHSRAHSTIRALATVMTIYEEFGNMSGLNVCYLGPAHPVLNSLLLLCPMLEANIRYKCCCDVTPVSPLLQKASEDLSNTQHTQAIACTKKEDVFVDCNVVIAGPTTKKEDKIKYFKINLSDIPKTRKWIFLHTCPRGNEVEDDVFHHDFARTYTMFENMQYIAGALMCNALVGYNFNEPCFPHP